MRALFVALLPLLSVACTPADQPPGQTFLGTTMGTTYAVTVVDAPRSGDNREDVRRAIDERLSMIDGMMSTHDPVSEVSRFNRAISTDWFPLSRDTFAVFQHAQEISEATGGAFDVTVGPLVEAWGFGAAEPPPAFPTDSEVERLLAQVGYRRIEFDAIAPAIRKTSPGVGTDLSAVAKGYAVDQVAELLDNAGYEAYLIEVGGEVRTRGRNARDRPWRVGIERPAPGAPSLQRVVELTDASLATSGDYRNYVERAGRRISHTIDPRTGRPVEHRLASVSVIDPLCVRADAMATALEVLGPDEGYALAVERQWAALLITRDVDGSYREQATPMFLAYAGDPPG